MSLKIGKYLFTGPFALSECVIRHNHPRALYAVVVKQGMAWDPQFRLIEIGVSPSQGLDFAADPRLAGWQDAGGGQALVYLHHATDTDDGRPHDLHAAEAELLAQFGPSGGIVTLSNGV